ncbi:MutS2 protein [Peptoclostridium acidaminophilum DSM 3953]|uniref:Endonuclease MutS2 n=1 Tax=Peptoclostridium acidaminophilum DSM 3953 TaxID=1286171 RepID=W8U5J4_PEPAC|nr:endonuclease MutS2 [Peptoclostridium acidaminophilum]AHM56196.1 MutS2 protein [Peptoclostridium acidaminophilum DSM 3953]
MNSKALSVLEYNKIVGMLVDKTTSSLGARHAREITPSSEMEEVQHMQKETSEAQSMILKSGNIPLGGIHDIEHLAKRAQLGSSLEPGQLLMVCDCLRAARRIKGFIGKNSPEAYPLMHVLSQELSVFRDIEDDIENSIIGENEIADTASHELKSIRRRLVQKNEDIRAKLHSIITSTSYQKYLQDAIITIRGDRFVVPVKQEYKSSVQGIVHDQSSSGATLFIEPISIVNMNNDLRELRLKEKEEIERILQLLSQRVGEFADEIAANSHTLGRIDFIFAKGKLSTQMRGIEPEITSEKYIRIKNGRHPLIPGNAVVPINIWLGREFDTLVITGPNTGGKTVTLKTVGLFCLMSQSGLHLPADFGTTMGVFEQVFADIGDEQSIEQSLSTFSSHMKNIVQILENVTADSLVLFDELGAGTDPVEGAALAMAILDLLHGLHVRAIATTHYSELKHYALTKAGVENASVEFDVATLSPTYRLLIGVPGKSNAFEISKRLGLEDYVIQKAKELIDTENIEFEDLLQEIEQKRQQAEADRLRTLSEKQEAERLKEDYRQKWDSVNRQKDKIISEAKREAQKILKSAKEDSDELVKKLRDIEKAGYTKEMNRKIEQVRGDIKKSMGKLQTGVDDIIIPKIAKKELKTLKPGDEVRVITLGQKGNVLSCDNKKKEALVQIGIMKMALPYASLEMAEQEAAGKGSTGAGRIMKRKAESIKAEIDLRGMNLEEAMYEVDKYLDDAYISGLEKVTIIHGVGTGVLKSGIKQMLKRHSHVKSSRDGEYGEGGMGVTVVHLK